MAFQLESEGEVMCYNGLDGDNDPLIAQSSKASGQPVYFTWENPYLTCFSSQFKATGKKHYLGVAQSHGKPFAAWDANKGEKYQWIRDGDTFKCKTTGYTVKKAVGVTDLHTNIIPVLQINGGGSGSIRKEIKYSCGYSSMTGITSEVHAKVCSEANAKFGDIGGSVSAELRTSFQSASNFTRSENVEMIDSIEVDMSQPTYIYSTECTFTFSGQSYSVSGGWVQSPIPLEM